MAIKKIGWENSNVQNVFLDLHNNPSTILKSWRLCTDFGTWDFACVGLWYSTLRSRINVQVNRDGGTVEGTCPPNFGHYRKVNREGIENRLLVFASKFIGSFLPVKSSNFLTFRRVSPIIENHKLIWFCFYFYFRKTTFLVFTIIRCQLNNFENWLFTFCLLGKGRGIWTWKIWIKFGLT